MLGLLDSLCPDNLYNTETNSLLVEINALILKHFFKKSKADQEPTSKDNHLWNTENKQKLN